MPRNVILVIATLIILSFSAAWAAPPLPPGKPAGVRLAQQVTSGAIAVGALALIAIGGFAISEHPYKIPGTSSATSTQP